MLNLKTRELDPTRDLCFFDAEEPISPQDRSAIRPLEDESAMRHWDELVSSNAREDHPMLLPQIHWRWASVETGPNWTESWDSRSSPDAVVSFLRENISWPDGADVIFIYSREDVLSVPWVVFLRNWRDFLIEDEGPFLLRVGFPEFVGFGPNGGVTTGRRFLI